MKRKYERLHLPILCWLLCRTEPNAIRSLTSGAREPRAAKFSPKKDASATALKGGFGISVRILLQYIFDFNCNN